MQVTFHDGDFGTFRVSLHVFVLEHVRRWWVRQRLIWWFKYTKTGRASIKDFLDNATPR